MFSLREREREREREGCVFYGVESWSGVMELEYRGGVAKILITPAESVYLSGLVFFELTSGQGTDNHFVQSDLVGSRFLKAFLFKFAT